jgi:hypothetical protein
MNIVTPTPSSSTTSLCAQCQAQPFKYKCPRCSIPTCSLACSQAHKSTTGCSGQRDKTKKVLLKDYGYGALMDDYKWLEEGRRRVEAWGKDIVDKGLMDPASLAEAQRETEAGGSRGGRGRGRGRGRGTGGKSSRVASTPYDEPQPRDKNANRGRGRGRGRGGSNHDGGSHHDRKPTNDQPGSSRDDQNSEQKDEPSSTEIEAITASTDTSTTTPAAPPITPLTISHSATPTDTQPPANPSTDHPHTSADSQKTPSAPRTTAVLPEFTQTIPLPPKLRKPVIPATAADTSTIPPTIGTGRGTLVGKGLGLGLGYESDDGDDDD